MFERNSKEYKANPFLKFALIAGLGSIALTGCATANAEQSPSPSATSSEAAPSNTPSETPTPTETETQPSNPDAEIAVATADRQKYMDMSTADFGKLPDQDHANFVAETDTIYMSKYVEGYQYSGTNSADYAFNPVTKESSPQDILDSTTWQLRLAFSLSGDEREKYLQAMLHDGVNSTIYPTWEGYSNDQLKDPVKSGSAAINKNFPKQTVKTAEPESDGTLNILATGVAGDTNEKFYYNEVALSDGTVVPIWRRN